MKLKVNTSHDHRSIQDERLLSHTMSNNKLATERRPVPVPALQMPLQDQTVTATHEASVPRAPRTISAREASNKPMVDEDVCFSGSSGEEEQAQRGQRGQEKGQEAEGTDQ